MSSRGQSLVRWTLLASLALYFVWFWGRWDPKTGWEAFDIYQYFYPNMLYAARSIARGGSGFFWNPLQMCGQPFFGISSTATLYPPHLLFLVLDPPLALRAVIAINLLIGGAGAYFLARAIGLGEIAALAGALSFQLGNAAIDHSTWTPQVAPAYMWMPAVMLCCERILAAPSFGRAVALGLALTLPWLVGSPQITFFTHQLIALRFVWELLTRPKWRLLGALPCLAFGIALPFLLGAVFLFPGIETARDSVRGIGLTRADLLGTDPAEWSDFVFSFSLRRVSFNPFVLVPAAVAGATILAARTWRQASFYALAGALYFALSFGPETGLFEIYTEMPFGTMFREPLRFMWVASFCMAVLTACGVEALVGECAGAARPFVRYGRVVAVMAACGGLWAISTAGMRAEEWALLGAVLAIVAVGALCPAHRGVAGAALIAAIAINLIGFLPWWRASTPQEAWFLRDLPRRRLLPDDAELRRHATVFQHLRAKMTAQDRAFLVHPHPSAALGPKTGSVFDVPVVQDYEPQPSRRFAEYVVRMRGGQRMTRLADYYYLRHGAPTPGFQRRLLDLTAARFLMVERSVDSLPAVVRPLPRAFPTGGQVRAYLNPTALPRARFVPQVEVVADPSAILDRLGGGPQDPRQVALIEEPLASGFTGTPGASGEVAFVRNDPEHVAVRVRASGPGFLHLADQFASGWHARLNGAPVPILRADYVFRLVEVPAGESIVEFDYAPASIRVGAAVSALTAAGLVGWAMRSRRRRRGAIRSR